MTPICHNSTIKHMDRIYTQNDLEHNPQIWRQVLVKYKKLTQFICFILLVVSQLSCSIDQNVEKKAKEFINSAQNLDIDKCVEKSSLYQTRLATIQNEPQFKKDQLIAEISNEIRRTILNQYDNDSIIYVFNFPCQWQILETKKLSQETSTGVISSFTEYYRVFIAIKYNSIENSPASIPLINKDYKSKYNIKEIILHCDFDPETKLYLGWGLDSHTRW